MPLIKDRSFFIIFIKTVLVLLIFFCTYRIAGIPTTHFITIIIALFFLTRKNNSQELRSLFIVDKINRYQFLILILIIFTYLIKLGNIEIIDSNYLMMTGSKTNYLYLKMAINGILSVLIYIFAYNMGRSFNGNYDKMRSVIIFIVLICTINGLANIIEWIITTGGVLARYNFTPPLIPSQGTSIGFSILGFMLALGIFDSKKSKEKLFFYLSLPILLLSIIIIISRQPQVTFLIKIVLFLFILRKRGLSKSRIKYIFGGAILMLLIYQFLNSTNDVTGNYTDLTTEGSTDIAARVGPILSAYELFLNNITTGIGYGMFGVYNTTPVIISEEVIYLASAHNGLAGIASEMGVIGIIINLILLFTINRKLQTILLYLKRNNSRSFRFTASVFSIIIVNTILLFVSNYFLFPPPSEFDYISGSFVYWLLLGMALSFASNTTTPQTTTIELLILKNRISKTKY